ncbi:hypothetical protein HQ531_09140 [bacterium]|nr:hypothetical protein [bacterium]
MRNMTIGIFIIASAIIWGAVGIGVSLKLSGTNCYSEISYIISTGAIFHLFFIMVPLALRFKKIKEEAAQ